MSMKITVGMPVKPYLKKYVYWKENLPEDTPLELTYLSEIFMVLGALLSGKFSIQKHRSCSDPLPSVYSDEIICKLTPERVDRGLFFYTLDHITFFNTYLYKTFHDDLLYMILLNKENGIDEKATIYTFMNGLSCKTGRFNLSPFSFTLCPLTLSCEQSAVSRTFGTC